MAYPVAQVAATINGPSGEPLAGAQVTAILAGPIVYQGVVLPTPYSVATDESGRCTLNLVPTDIGITPTTYTLEIWAAHDCRPEVFAGVMVPNVSSITLDELLGRPLVIYSIYWNDQAFWDDSAYWIES